jgi:hypothetical protein
MQGKINCVLEMYIIPVTMEIGMEVPQKIRTSQALVAHACNSSYSGGRDQEDYGLGSWPG